MGYCIWFALKIKDWKKLDFWSHLITIDIIVTIIIIITAMLTVIIEIKYNFCFL